MGWSKSRPCMAHLAFYLTGLVRTLDSGPPPLAVDVPPSHRRRVPRVKLGHLRRVDAVRAIPVSVKKFRVGLFLDFARASTRTMHPRGADVQMSGRTRTDPHLGRVDAVRAVPVSEAAKGGTTTQRFVLAKAFFKRAGVRARVCLCARVCARLCVCMCTCARAGVCVWRGGGVPPGNSRLARVPRSAHAARRAAHGARRA